jgi:nucleoside-diphosphate-sugar epimerase
MSRRASLSPAQPALFAAPLCATPVGRADALLYWKSTPRAALPTPLDRLGLAAFDVVYADLRNYQLTARAVREAQPSGSSICRRRRQRSLPEPPHRRQHNVGGTLNLLRACFEARDATAHRRPHTRRTAPTCPYAASKAAAWTFGAMYARAAGWPIHGAMIFRPMAPASRPTCWYPLR